MLRHSDVVKSPSSEIACVQKSRQKKYHLTMTSKLNESRHPRRTHQFETGCVLRTTGLAISEGNKDTSVTQDSISQSDHAHGIYLHLCAIVDR